MTDLERLRVLVVEDHGFQRWLMCDLLQKLEVSVQGVGDGQAALEALARGGIDVVVSDLDMPTVDGMELMRHMAERGHRAGFVVVSAKEPALLATVEVMAREYGVNFVASIQKPLTAGKFQEAVAQFRSSDTGGPSAVQVTRQEIVAGLRRGEFEAFFQPKAQIKSGQVQGAEALVRWRHPRHGWLSPAAFMDLIESGGLIDELTAQVVHQALAAFCNWRDTERDIGVSVNLSALSLSDATLAERMTALAAEFGVEPQRVTFEITESAAGRDLGRTLENLSRLRMRGFELSIDDFGTGYSSMHRLSRIPFTELKIDQSFVRAAGRAGPSGAIVESSIALARRLGIRAVAEGVETRAEWEMLLGMGCEFAQGYFIATPMEASQFLGWLQHPAQVCG